MEISNRDLLQVGTSACINIQTQSTINWLTLPLIFHLLEQDTNCSTNFMFMSLLLSLRYWCIGCAKVIIININIIIDININIINVLVRDNTQS